MKQEIILNTADGIVEYRADIKGWVGKDGRYYGDSPDSERCARYANSTHKKCDDCDRITTRGWARCDHCRHLRDVATWEAKDKQQWDSVTPVFSASAERYFFDVDELEEFLADKQADDPDFTADDLLLYLCEPCHAREIEPADYLHDDLPEDGEVPEFLQKAFDELNKAIREYRKTAPLSWVSGTVAVKWEAS